MSIVSGISAIVALATMGTLSGDLIKPAKVVFMLLPLFTILTCPNNADAATQTTKNIEVSKHEYSVAGFGDWLNRQMDQLLNINQEPTTKSNSQMSVPTDLQQEKENNEAQAASNRRACQNEYDSATSNYGYGSMIVKDGKIWSIYNSCNGSKSRPNYEYQGQLGQVMRSSCGDLTQYKLVDSELCMFYRGFSSNTIEKRCDKRN